MSSQATQVQLLVSTNTGDYSVALVLNLEEGRVIKALYDAPVARELAADLIRFADDCDAANARADAVAAGLLEKFMRQEGTA